MSGRNEPAQNWFRLPVQFDLDEEMVRLPLTEQMLFLRIVAMCSGLRNGGRLSDRQLTAMTAGMAKGRQAIRRLVESGVLSESSRDAIATQSGGSPDATATQSPRSPDAVATQSPRNRDAGATQSPRNRDAGATQSPRNRDAIAEQSYCITNAKKWLYLGDQQAGVSAGQRPAQPASSDAGGPRARTQAPARGEKERERERTTSRLAPPDRRDVVARAAPRLGGAEPRPAPVEDQKQSSNPVRRAVDDEPEDPDTLVGLEHLSGPALAKEALRRSIANGSRPNRLPVKMSKFPRDMYPVLPNEADTDYWEEK